MSTTMNVKGTSVPSFTIGKKGLTLYQGDIDPNTVSNVTQGDYWLDQTTRNLNTWDNTSGTWRAPILGGLQLYSEGIYSAADISIIPAELGTVTIGNAGDAVLSSKLGGNIIIDPTVDGGNNLLLGPARLIWPKNAGTTGQVLVSQGNGGMTWATPIDTSGTLSLDSLSDVVIIDPQQFQHLEYNGTQWINILPATPSLTDLPDTLIVNPLNAQVLTWNGSKWVNADIPPPATPALALDQLTDVVILSPTANEILSYNGSSWINSPLNAVVSVNSKTGIVTLSNVDVGAAATVHTHTAAQVSGLATIATTGSYNNLLDTPTTYSGYGITDVQPLDADLTSIAGLLGASGLLRKIAVNTWSLDTTDYLKTDGTNSMAGNLSFSNTGQRITGDFSNATFASRLMLQTSTTNSITNVGIIPNGTGSVAGIGAFNNSDPANASTFQFLVEGPSGVARINSATTGSGTLLPMSFQINLNERFRLSATENRFQADFSNSNVSNRLCFQTSVPNGNTGVILLPNGTSITSAIRAGNNSDTNLASYGDIAIDITAVQIRSLSGPTAPALPLSFRIDNLERFRLSTSENRLQADFSNAAPAARLMFQTSTTDNFTAVGALPNGTSNASYFIASNSSDAANASYGYLAAIGNEVRITSSFQGTGTYLPIIVQTGGAERMRVGVTGAVSFPVLAADNVSNINAGNLNIVANSAVGYPAIGYNIASGNASNTWRFAGADNASWIQFVGNTINFYRNVNAPSSGGLITNAASMTIDINGNLLIGATSLTSSVKTKILYNGAVNQYGLELRPVADNTTSIIFKTADDTNVGSISQTTTTTTYNTTSDYRLKKNVRVIDNIREVIDKIKPVKFDWRLNNEESIGFIAHELQEIVPFAVTGEKDAIDKDNKLIPQGIDPSKLVAYLAAAVKDLYKEIDTLKENLTITIQEFKNEIELLKSSKTTKSRKK